LLKNPKFATESTQTPLRELTRKKILNLAPQIQNSAKYAIFRSQSKKFAPETPLRWGGGVPGGPHLQCWE